MAVLLTIAGVCAGGGSAAAASRTWDGGNASNNFDLHSNWSGAAGGTKPSSGDDLVFDGLLGATANDDCVIDTNTYYNSLTIASTYTGTITLSGTRSMRITGNFVQNGGTLNAPTWFTVNGTFTQGGGTFVGGSQVVVLGNFSQTNGTFTGPTGRFVVAGNLSSSGGTFSQPAGSAIFTPGAVGTKTHVFNGAFKDVVLRDGAGPSTTGLTNYWKLDSITTTAGTDYFANTVASAPSLTILAPDLSLAGSAPIAVANTGHAYFVAASNDYLYKNGDVDGLANEGLAPAGGAYSLAAWVYPSSLDTGATGCAGGSADIMSAGHNGRLSVDYALRYCKDAGGTTRLQMEFRKNVSSTISQHVCSSDTAVTINDGYWHHVVGVNDGTTLSIYYDGVKVSSCASHAPGVQSYDGQWFYVGTHPIHYDSMFNGTIDEVRFYTRALTDAEVLMLAQGTAGVSGAVTHSATGLLDIAAGGTLSAGTAISTLSGGLRIGAGATATTGASAVTIGFDATLGRSLVLNGALTTGAGTVTLGARQSDVNSGGVLTIGGGSLVAVENVVVNAGGKIVMGTTSGVIDVADTKLLTINGTLETTTGTSTPKPKLKATSGNFGLRVGTTNTSTPTLNINGLAVENADTHGMWINTDDAAVTTFTSFKNIDFANTRTLTGGGLADALLRIRVSSQTASFTEGLTFDTTHTTANVKLEDRDTAGGANDVRLTFAATCSPVSENDCEANDADQDADSNGVGDSGGAVAQFVSALYTDTTGVAVGFPVSAFSWDDLSFRGTYAAFNDVGGKGRLYLRSSSGQNLGSWDVEAAGQNFVGPPRWSHDTAANKFYVFVVTTGGYVYKLEENGAGFTQIASYRDGALANVHATATTPLAMDASNLYWVGNSGLAAATPLMFSLPQATLTNPESLAVTAGSAPASVAAVLGVRHLFFGTHDGGQGRLHRMVASPLTDDSSSTHPSAAVYSRVSVIGGLAYFVDDKGKVSAVDARSLATYWTYQDTGSAGHDCSVAGGSCSAKDIFVNAGQARVYYGDHDGHFYAVGKGAGTAGAVVGSNYPLLLESGTNVFVSAPLYRNGVVAIGSTTGKVYFIDQLNASGQAALIRTIDLGSGVEISSISYNRTADQYTVATSTGRLYYLPKVIDPSELHD